MDTLTAIAASCLRARMESLDLLANNVANATTGGFKADREFYSLYAAPEAMASDSAATMPVIEKPWVDHSQGTVHATGNPLDLALTGHGFFAVNGPNGPLYTRSGNFRLAPDGKIVTGDGYPVRDQKGTPLTVVGRLPVDVSSDGTVTQDGAAIGRLDVVDFTSTAGLTKQGNTYFRATDPAQKPSTAPDATIEQGSLEASNTGSADAAVRLISVMRQFDMMQRAVTLGTEMNRKAIEEVAKV